jgi:hypothetical protein
VARVFHGRPQRAQRRLRAACGSPAALAYGRSISLASSLIGGTRWQ